MKRIKVFFYKLPSGNEPMRDWLKKLSREDKRIIGEDIKTVEFGWPLGMPLVKKLDKNLWEVRCDISNHRIARVLFTIHKSKMVLLHGFIKKSQKTPPNDLKIAKLRRDEIAK